MASEQNEEVIRSTIYPTMWLPTLAWGIPRDYALFAVLVATLALWLTAITIGVNISRFVALGVLVFLWIAGAIMAKFDPEFFGVFLCETFQIGRTKNRGGDNEYLA